MWHHSAQPTGILTQNTDPVTRPSPRSIIANVLDTHRRRQFSQRLAVLIDRIRKTAKEGTADER